MAQTSGRAVDHTAPEGTMRLNWLRAMYVANIVISGPIGVAALAAPGVTRTVFGIPAAEPVSFGIAIGAIPLAFGIAGVGGLRAPLRLSPILGLQVVYKSLFLIGVVLPWLLVGQIPSYALPVVGIFLFFIIGNLIAIPYPYVLSYPSDREGSS